MESIPKKNNVVKIGISGKRNISSTERERVYLEIKSMIIGILKKNNVNGFMGYTSLASGADTIFAEVVKKEFQQSLHIILPFAAAEYKKDFEGNELEIFEKLIAENNNYQIAESNPPGNNESRASAYYKAGKMIADECDEMIFVWDKQKPGGKGGTAEILGYAAEHKKVGNIHIIIVNPTETDALNEAISTKYHEADQKALHTRDKYRRVWKSAIILGWLAVFCLAFKVAFHIDAIKFFLVAAEFILVLTVFILFFNARKKNYHGNYLQERIKAETYRLLHSFYHAGIEVTISEQTKKTDKEMACMAEKINESVKSPGNQSKWYAQYVIKSLIHDQCAYHQKKIKTIGNKHHTLERSIFIIAVAFFINLFLLLLISFFEYFIPSVHFPYPESLSIFLSILLPATYAAVEGFVHFNEWTTLKKYSVSALQSLTESKELLAENLEQHSFIEGHKKQSEVLNLISGIMLSDNKNWSLLLENKHNYHLIV